MYSKLNLFNEQIIKTENWRETPIVSTYPDIATYYLFKHGSDSFLGHVNLSIQQLQDAVDIAYSGDTPIVSTKNCDCGCGCIKSESFYRPNFDFSAWIEANGSSSLDSSGYPPLKREYFTNASDSNPLLSNQLFLDLDRQPPVFSSPKYYKVWYNGSSYSGGVSGYFNDLYYSDKVGVVEKNISGQIYSGYMDYNTKELINESEFVCGQPGYFTPALDLYKLNVEHHDIKKYQGYTLEVDLPWYTSGVHIALSSLFNPEIGDSIATEEPCLVEIDNENDEFFYSVGETLYDLGVSGYSSGIAIPGVFDTIPYYELVSAGATRADFTGVMEARGYERRSNIIIFPNESYSYNSFAYNLYNMNFYNYNSSGDIYNPVYDSGYSCGPYLKTPGVFYPGCLYGNVSGSGFFRYNYYFYIEYGIPDSFVPLVQYDLSYLSYAKVRTRNSTTGLYEINEYTQSYTRTEQVSPTTLLGGRNFVISDPWWLASSGTNPLHNVSFYANDLESCHVFSGGDMFFPNAPDEINLNFCNINITQDITPRLLRYKQTVMGLNEFGFFGPSTINTVNVDMSPYLTFDQEDITAKITFF